MGLPSNAVGGAGAGRPPSEETGVGTFYSAWLIGHEQGGGAATERVFGVESKASRIGINESAVLNISFQPDSVLEGIVAVDARPQTPPITNASGPALDTTPDDLASPISSNSSSSFEILFDSPRVVGGGGGSGGGGGGGGRGGGGGVSGSIDDRSGRRENSSSAQTKQKSRGNSVSTPAHVVDNILYRRSVDGAIFYKFSGKWYYVDTPDACAGLQLHAAIPLNQQCNEGHLASIGMLGGSTDVSGWCPTNGFGGTAYAPFIKTIPEKKKLCRKAISHVRGTAHKGIQPSPQRAKSKQLGRTPGAGTGNTGIQQGKSAVATPYNLIPGGGERYLLSMVKAMQLMGEHVDIIVYPGNSCATVQCVKGTAEAVRVDIGTIEAAPPAQQLHHRH